MSAAALASVLDVLALEAPVEVARGRVALKRALSWTDTSSWSEVAWSFSDLAGGSPVELVWRPGRHGLFWTAEPAPPEWPTSRRVRRALALARLLGSRFDRTEISKFKKQVSSSKSAWPIWVGGRHDASGDLAKLYALTASASVGEFLHGATALLHRPNDQMAMIGLSADGGREYYWRRPSPPPGDRWHMAREPSLSPMVARLDAALGEWTSKGLDSTDLGRIGFSLKLSPAGEPTALAAFMRVRQVGGEKNVRRRLLKAGGFSNPALASFWAAGRLRPMFLTLAATPDAVIPSIGLRLAD
jgi:hypothetical protein